MKGAGVKISYLDTVFACCALPSLFAYVVITCGGLTDWQPWIASEWRLICFAGFAFGYLGIYLLLRMCLLKVARRSEVNKKEEAAM